MQTLNFNPTAEFLRYVDRVLKVTARVMRVHSLAITGTKTIHEDPLVRAVVVEVLRIRTGLSYPKLGRFLSRDHAALVHYARAVDQEIVTAVLSQLTGRTPVAEIPEEPEQPRRCPRCGSLRLRLMHTRTGTFCVECNEEMQ